MNKFSITAVFLAIIVTFSSCNILETESQSSFDAPVVFSDPLLAEFFLLGVFDVLGINNSYRNRLIHTFSNADTEIHNASLNGLTENGRRALAIFRINADNGDINGANNPFTFAYIAIERLNLLLDGIRRYGGGPESCQALGRVYGEALALRAFFYFDLIRWHGDVPARFEPVNSETLFVGRANRDIIYAQILEDLRIASKLLPWPGETASHSRVYRMNRAFAHAFRARVALHAGGYSLRADNGPDADGVIRLSEDRPCPETGFYLSRSEMFEIARTETYTLIWGEGRGRGFRLESSFEQIFRDNMREEASVGRESIFELPYSPGSRGQWLSFYGVRHVGLDRFNASPSNVKGEAGPSPIMWYWFAEGDTRRDVSVVPFRWEGTNSATTARQVIQAGSGTPSVRIWYFGKLRADWGARRMSSNDDGIRPIVMRFADVLLMFAEAENELNGPTDDARYALRTVRERAFAGAPDPLNINGLSQEAFFQAIMDERAFEFLGEQRRKYDLNRWNMLRANLDWARRQTLRLRDGLAVGSGGRLFAIPGNRDIDFTDVPRHIFWRHVDHPTLGADVQIVEIFGLNRGEFPRNVVTGEIIEMEPGTTAGTYIITDELEDWMESFRGGDVNPWNPYTGTGTAQLAWIDQRVDTDARPLSNHFINNAFFDARVNPDQRSLFPIWARQVADSQGYLWNYFRY